MQPFARTATRHPIANFLRQALDAVFDIGSTDEPPMHGPGGIDVWDLASATSSEEPPMHGPGGQPVRKHCHPKDKECGKPKWPQSHDSISTLDPAFCGPLLPGIIVGKKLSSTTLEARCSSCKRLD